MTIYYCYEIKTLQPLKMGGTGSQADNEAALDYIAGSALRGAFIGAYLQEKPGIELHQDGHMRRQWLEGDLRFLNGYLSVDGRRSWPFPACLYMTKDNRKLFGEQEQPVPVVNPLANLIDEQMERVPAAGFISDGYAEQFTWYQTKMTAKLHINLQADQTRLYRYEAIAPGQSFISVVAVEHEDDEIKSFLQSFSNKTIYLGGSKSNGYGKCQVIDVTRWADNPEYPDNLPDFAQTVYVYCLSDVIIRDEAGRLSPRIPECILAAGLGVERVILESAAVQTIVTDGFNQKWGARLPKQQAIQKGSVFKYRYESNINKSKAERFLHQGIGERCVDGFGRIALLPEMRMCLVSKGQAAPMSPQVPSPGLSQEERKQVRQILRRVVMQRIRTGLENRILEWSQDSDDEAISSSQLAQWMNLFSHAKGQTPDEGKAKIEQYILQLEKRVKDQNGRSENTERVNQKALQSLMKARIGEQTWLERICSYVQQADNVNELIHSLQLPELSIAGQDGKELLSKEEVYRLNMEMLYQYLRERRRLANHKGQRGQEG